jgi:lysophospholipase L1-like esterase
MIIIQSILPVSYSYQINKPTMSNEKIDAYNELLENLAVDKGCKYLDTSSVLKDSNNCLSSVYDSGDGLHFNAQAYEALLKYFDQYRIY